MPNVPVHAALLSPNQGSWARVIFDGFKPGLSGPANPPSLVSRRAQNATLESPVMILSGLSMAEMTKKGKMVTMNAVGQSWLY